MIFFLHNYMTFTLLDQTFFHCKLILLFDFFSFTFSLSSYLKRKFINQTLDCLKAHKTRIITWKWLTHTNHSQVLFSI